MVWPEIEKALARGHVETDPFPAGRRWNPDQLQPPFALRAPFPRQSIDNFAMVHDSYSVHACDLDLLNRILREEFVRIYSEPVLQNFLKEQRQTNPELELPEPPQAGNLDIRGVIESPYCLA
jgi:DNA-directed RNA polymerase